MLESSNQTFSDIKTRKRGTLRDNNIIVQLCFEDDQVKLYVLYMNL